MKHTKRPVKVVTSPPSQAETTREESESGDDTTQGDNEQATVTDGGSDGLRTALIIMIALICVCCICGSIGIKRYFMKDVKQMMGSIWKQDPATDSVVIQMGSASNVQSVTSTDSTIPQGEK
eukprot:322325_1